MISSPTESSKTQFFFQISGSSKNSKGVILSEGVKWERSSYELAILETFSHPIPSAGLTMVQVVHLNRGLWTQGAS